MVLSSGRAVQVNDESTGRPQKARTTYLMNSEIGEQCLCLLITYRRVNDHVIALVPVDGSCDTVLVAELKRVDHSDDFIL